MLFTLIVVHRDLILLMVNFPTVGRIKESRLLTVGGRSSLCIWEEGLVLNHRKPKGSLVIVSAAAQTNTSALRRSRLESFSWRGHLGMHLCAVDTIYGAGTALVTKESNYSDLILWRRFTPSRRVFSKYLSVVAHTSRRVPRPLTWLCFHRPPLPSSVPTTFCRVWTKKQTSVVVTQLFIIKRLYI